jgi:CheY-like chemotaxis protein
MPTKILYIEDTLEQRQLLEKILARRGFEMTTAPNGPEGIATARCISPDVVIVDLVMPLMDGIEVIKELRTCPAMADVPVIAFSVLQGGEVARKALEAGANLYVSKPIEPRELENIIKDAVASKESP